MKTDETHTHTHTHTNTHPDQTLGTNIHMKRWHGENETIRWGESNPHKWNIKRKITIEISSITENKLNVEFQRAGKHNQMIR